MLAVILSRDNGVCSAEKLSHELITSVGLMSDGELIFLLSCLYDTGKNVRLRIQAAELLGYRRVCKILNSIVLAEEKEKTTSDLTTAIIDGQRLLRLVEAHVVQILKKRQVVV